MLPAVGRSSPPRRFNKVDLPEPDLPTSAIFSARPMEIVTPRNACTGDAGVPYVFARATVRISGWLVAVTGILLVIVKTKAAACLRANVINVPQGSVHLSRRGPQIRIPIVHRITAQGCQYSPQWRK